MQIPLDQFEQYIDETILKRGLSYFKNGQVNEPEEITPGVYEAVVEGSEDYAVELKIKNGNITEYTCDCPYDMGPVCKHVTAVIFYLQQDHLELKQNAASKKSDRERKTEKPKSVAGQVNEVLSKISPEELKQFILEKTKHDPSFRNIFLSSFAHQITGESKELYSKQVKSILRTAAGRDGYIDWSAVRHVGNTVDTLVEAAQKHFENKNFRSAVFICCAVMEEMTEALQYADDSNGDIGGSIDLAYNLLHDIASQEPPEEIRNLLFDYCLESFEKRIYSGWDWDLGMLHLASELLKNEDEAQRIIAFLDNVQHSDYEKEEAQSIKLQILKKTKGEEEAGNFIEQNLSNSSFRREAIMNAMQDKNYEKAISIAQDGVRDDAKEKPGLAMEWYDWLLKIAIEQNEKDKIIEYARLLFIDNFRHEQDYYKLMKSNVQPESWNNFVEGIIKDLRAKKRWLDFDLISRIYIMEEWWDRLIGLVEQNPSLTTIEQYEKYLSKDYSDRLTKLYAEGITEYMKNSMGRSHYQTACKYLRRMIKLGAKEKAYRIMDSFRREYPQRRALMEELNRV